MTSRRRTSKGGCGGLLFGAVWITVWSAGTLAFDGMLLHGIYRQWKATGFPATVGTVAHSEVVVDHDDDGTSYRVDVRYTYSVDRRQYEGDTYRYGMTSFGENEAYQIVESLAAGREVDVYYNPQDPADSVLRPGIEGADLFLALFLMPFNVIMLGAWAVAVRHFFPPEPDRPAGGARIVRRGFRQYVCTSAFRPVVVAVAVLLGTSFVSIFVVAFGFGPNPAVPAIVTVWGTVVSLTLFSYVWCRVRVGAGRTHLILDELARTVTLPASKTDQRGVPLMIRYPDVESVGVREKPPTHSGRAVSRRYEIVLGYRGGNGQQQVKIAEKSNRAEAEGLAAWIEEQIKGVSR